MKVRVTQLERGVDGITRRYDRIIFNPIEWGAVRLSLWQRNALGLVVVLGIIFAVAFGAAWRG